MSIRLRLALWYGSLFALVLLLVTLLSYAFHTRAHYDDMDRALVTSVGHAAAEAATMAEPHLVEGSGGLEVSLRLYDAAGRSLEKSSGMAPLPNVDPRAVLASPAGAPFDVMAGLVPSVAGPPPQPEVGAFGLLQTPDQRWRTYVVPLGQSGQIRGYVEAIAPLGRLDESVARLRVLLLVIGITGWLAALLGSWAIAGQALRPVDDLVYTARAIEQGRDLSRRVPTPPQPDELGRLAETFNEMLASLEESSRAQQRFVADASHELRTPLTAIQGNLELLRRQPSMAADERAEALAEAEREAARLTRLVADLLALARADSGVTLKREVVDLDAVVLEAMSAARPLARGQAVNLATFEPVQVTGDKDRLTQLLVILLDNAFKYTSPRGTVTVHLCHNATRAHVRIEDTGIGIAADALPHVFERFYRADQSRARDPGGTGLGLPIAKWIVEQHGGEIDLRSEIGRGTTVDVALPCS